MLLRDALGETLRNARVEQNRTLRDVSTAANVSLGYLSEVERGRKEASSELLAAICDALELRLADILDTASQSLRSGPAGVAKAGLTGSVVGNSAKASLAPTAARRPQEKASAAAPVDGRSLRIVLPYRLPRPNPTRA